MRKTLHAALLSLGLGLMIIFCGQEARADLILPTVLVDNPTAFHGTLNVTQFTVATFTFSSVNWNIRVREDFIGSEILPNEFEITVQHLVTPDPGGAVPGPVMPPLVLFASSSMPGGPPRGPFLFSAVHDSTFDYLQVSYVPIAPGQSQLIIQTSHGPLPTTVPEPSTLLILGSGLLCCAFLGLTRRHFL